jgi:hypothetical protein
MNRAIFLIFPFLCFPCLAEEVRVKPRECGPLARGELGVVFSTEPYGQRQTYFVKGSAMDVCPKIMSAKAISGTESNYCDNYTPSDKRECKAIKVLTITEYHED